MFLKSKDRSKNITKAKTNYFERLPQEMILNIFSFLNPKEKLVASKVSKLWYTISNIDSLWKPHCEEEGVTAIENHKSAYINKMISHKIHYILLNTKIDDIHQENLVLSKETILYKNLEAVPELNKKFEYLPPPYFGTEEVVYAVKVSDEKLRKMNTKLTNPEPNKKTSIHALEVNVKSVILPVVEIYLFNREKGLEKIVTNLSSHEDISKNSCTIS